MYLVTSVWFVFIWILSWQLVGTGNTYCYLVFCIQFQVNKVVEILDNICDILKWGKNFPLNHCIPVPRAVVHTNVLNNFSCIALYI